VLDAAVLLEGRLTAWEPLLGALKPGAAVVAAVSWRGVCAAEDTGFEIKDGLLWVRPTGHVRLMLARKPLDGTLASNTLKWGVGGINVGACRNGVRGGTTRSHQTHQYTQIGWTTGHEVVPIDAGRWPTNVILSHAEECRLVGTKKVGNGPARTHAEVNIPSSWKPGYGYGTNSSPSMASYGQEEVEDWECVLGCPVRALDWQTGHSKSPAPYVQQTESRGRVGAGMSVKGRITPHYGDEGGGSRFFTTLPADPLALPGHLIRLIAPLGSLVFGDNAAIARAAEQAGWRYQDTLSTENGPATMGSP